VRWQVGRTGKLTPVAEQPLSQSAAPQCAMQRCTTWTRSAVSA
jgi:hypothetical protein